MNCPVCKKTELELEDIDTGLGAGVCQTCNGRWISLQSYQAWLEFKSHIPVHNEEENKTAAIPRHEPARICPRCGRILTKYRIAVESPLNIDRCSLCSGAWLDADDWKALKTKNLHVALDKIFTDHWQDEISREKTRQTLTNIYRKKFGPENFEKLRAFKQWIFDQENREEILSYLRDNSPLQL